MAQEIVITDEDCSVGMDIPYMEVSDINIKDGKSVKNIESLETTESLGVARGVVDVTKMRMTERLRELVDRLKEADGIR